MAYLDGDGASWLSQELLDRIKNGMPGENVSGSGEAITLSLDSSNYKIKSLTIYGKSTQDGTPTPDNPIDIVSVGEGGTLTEKAVDSYAFSTMADNFQWGTVANGNIYSSNSYSGYRVSYKENISIKPNTTYMITTSNDNARIGIHTKASDGTFLSDSGWKSNGGTITTDANAQYCAIVINDTNGSSAAWGSIPAMLKAFDICLTVKEPSVTAMEIPEPLRGIPLVYTGVEENYTDSNGQRWISDTLEINSDGSGVITRRCGTATFDGTEAWQLVSSDANNAVIKTNTKFPNGDYSNGGTMVLSNVKGTATKSDTYGNVRFPAWGNSWLYLMLGTFVGGAFTTIEEYTEYLQKNNLSIIYKLQESAYTTESLTASQVSAFLGLTAYSPTTVIYNTDGAYQEIELATTGTKGLSGRVDTIEASSPATLGNLVAFGDSICQGNNNDDYSYVDVLTDLGVFDSVIKHGIGSSTLGNYSGLENDDILKWGLGASFYDSAFNSDYESEIVNADNIIVQYGANDVLALNTISGTIGTATGLEEGSTCKQVDDALAHIYELNPDVIVTFIDVANTRRAEKLFATAYSATCNAGAGSQKYTADAFYATLHELNEQIKRVFSKYNVNIISIIDVVPLNSANISQFVSSDGSHPNTKGHTKIAEEYLKSLRSKSSVRQIEEHLENRKIATLTITSSDSVIGATTYEGVSDISASEMLAYMKDGIPVMLYVPAFNGYCMATSGGYGETEAAILGKVYTLNESAGFPFIETSIIIAGNTVYAYMSTAS